MKIGDKVRLTLIGREDLGRINQYDHVKAALDGDYGIITIVNQEGHFSISWYKNEKFTNVCGAPINWIELFIDKPDPMIVIEKNLKKLENKLKNYE